MPKNPKRLLRGNDPMIFGVCQGLGEFLQVDPTVIRLAWIIITAFTGVFPGLVAYIICAVVIPSQSTSK